SSRGSLVYSSYLGGSGFEFGNGIAVDASGNAYVNGTTSSMDFPLAAPVQTANGGGLDAFVAKVTDSGTLGYATYLGGEAEDQAVAIAADAAGNAYVAGYTYSKNFPTTSGAFQTNSKGAPSNPTAFVAK